jgi:hypothetical protein
MNAIIVDSNIPKAISAFRNKLKELAGKPQKLQWAFPSGNNGEFPTYTLVAQNGTVQVGLPEKWNKRVPHLFRLDLKDSPQSPHVEVNIPLSLDRKVAGVYVSSSRNYLLCHRGNFTAHRTPIPRDAAFDYFEKWLIDVEDGGACIKVIPVVSLDSETFSEDIVTFVQSVLKMKIRYKESKRPNTKSGQSIWYQGKEYEGKKQPSGNGAHSEYEYLHGPICNRLDSHIRSLLDKNHSCRKNSNIDLAVVNNGTEIAEIIFEVKTAALPSSQIYSAIGQLFYYRLKYGNKKSRLCVVLPDRDKSKVTQELLDSVGITLVYEHNKGFVLANGTQLLEFVRNRK